MAKTTDELFAEATEADYETVEPVTLAASDTEEEFQFRIDEHLRTIAIPEKGVVAGVEGDLNVNIARFVMVRYYHGRDLSKLNIRINYRNANGQVNYYTVSDATVSGDSIVFSWEYAADVTQYKGNVQFVVYLFSATNAVLKQRFFTTLGTLEVLEGLEVDSSIPASEQTDILLHLKKDLAAYAEEVKKSLPADYTAMTEQVSSLKEDLSELEIEKKRPFILGKNLFNLSDCRFNGENYSVTLDVDKNTGYTHINGTRTNPNTGIFRYTIFEFVCLEGGNYTFSVLNTDKGVNRYHPSIYVTCDNAIVETLTIALTEISITMEPEKTYKFELYIPNDGKVYDYIVCYQLEKGERTLFEKVKYMYPNDYMLENSRLKGKKLSIIGVSIDTYPNYIVSGNKCYYSTDPTNDRYLESVEMTWWKQLLNRTGMEMLVNNSWSGATVSTINGIASSGVQRCLNLGDNPDVIIVGAFPLNDWAYSSIGEYHYTDVLPTMTDDLTDSAVYNRFKAITDTFSGALASLLYRLTEKYPNAEVYVMDGYNYARGTKPKIPMYDTTKNAVSVTSINKALYEICDIFGANVIHTSKCGLNSRNCKTYCTSDGIHPLYEGHKMIYRQCLHDMKI